MNRWFLDTEFVEDGKTIELASIGLVNFEGTAEYYAVSQEWVLGKSTGDLWFQQNVTPKLWSVAPRGVSNVHDLCTPRQNIATDLLALFGLVRGAATHGTPEIWADFASYDWIALCQLYGRMIDLPPGMPMFCMDLQQLLTHSGQRRVDLPRQDPTTEHNALADARHLRTQYRYTQGLNW